MVKETKYRHHPVRIEKGLFLGSQQLDILGFRLALLNAALTSATNISTQAWHPMNLNTLVVAAGATVPQDAIAVILSVKAKDDGVGDYYMDFASVAHSGVPPGVVGVQPGKTQTVYIGQGADVWGSRIVIVELSEDSRILTKVTGVNLDYSINLIGWLIGGTRVSKLTLPAEDLYCRFMI